MIVKLLRVVLLGDVTMKHFVGLDTFVHFKSCNIFALGAQLWANLIAKDDIQESHSIHSMLLLFDFRLINSIAILVQFDVAFLELDVEITDRFATHILRLLVAGSSIPGCETSKPIQMNILNSDSGDANESSHRNFSFLCRRRLNFLLLPLRLRRRLNWSDGVAFVGRHHDVFKSGICYSFSIVFLLRCGGRRTFHRHGERWGSLRRGLLLTTLLLTRISERRWR